MKKPATEFNNANDNKGSAKPAAKSGYGVAVFAASSMMNDPGYAADAAYVGKALGEKGHKLIYGGGSRGLMGVVSESAMKAGGEIAGYMMECFNESVQYPQKDFETYCHTLADRKQDMLLAADAYIALGGGFGTLDEILEAGIEQYMGGYMDPPVPMKPIILINRNGIYEPFMAQLDKFVQEGSAKPAVRDFFVLVKDGKEAIDTLEQLRKEPAKPSVAVGNVQNAAPGR